MALYVENDQDTICTALVHVQRSPHRLTDMARKRRREWYKLVSEFLPGVQNFLDFACRLRTS